MTLTQEQVRSVLILMASDSDTLAIIARDAAKVLARREAWEAKRQVKAEAARVGP